VRYFAHIGQHGPIRYGALPDSIGVLEASDKFMPIGEAHCITWDEQGLALWELRVHDRPVSGRFIIRDREFIPARE
jgi:hypothetical protein